MFQNIVYKKWNALQRKSDVQTDHHLTLNMDYSRRNCIKERDKDKERRKYSSPDNEDFVMTWDSEENKYYTMFEFSWI